MYERRTQGTIDVIRGDDPLVIEQLDQLSGLLDELANADLEAIAGRQAATLSVAALQLLAIVVEELSRACGGVGVAYAVNSLGSFPIILETYREVLSDVFDLPALRGLLAAYAQGVIDFEQLDASVQGWINHVRYGDTWGLRRTILEEVGIWPTYKEACPYLPRPSTS